MTYIFIGKDKSRLSMDVDQFQLKSSIMKIYDKFETIDGIPKFDVCLIKTETDENGIHFDLSEQFDRIPCFPKMLNLTEVFKYYKSIFLTTNCRHMALLVGLLAGENHALTALKWILFILSASIYSVANTAKIIGIIFY